MACKKCGAAMTRSQHFCAACGAGAAPGQTAAPTGGWLVPLGARLRQGETMSAQTARQLVKAGAVACALTAAIALLGWFGGAHLSQGRLAAIILFGAAAAGLWFRNARLAAAAAGFGALLVLIVSVRLGANQWTACSTMLLAVLAAAGMGAQALTRTSSSDRAN